MKLKKNDLLTLEVTDITNLGFGVSRKDGEVIFLADAVPGDVVKGKIIKISSSFAIGRVEKIITRSPLRSDDRCKNSHCRACAYKNLSYEREKSLKEESVRQIFRKNYPQEIKILPIIGSPLDCGYRNKAQYPVSIAPDGKYVIGFYAPKSHRVTEAADCPLAPAIFTKILNALRSFFEKHSLSVYNEKNGKGLLRHIYLRRGEISCEILLTIVINGVTLPYSDELVYKIKKEFPDVVGILLNVNQKNTNVILGDEYITLYGRDHIFDTLAGVKLKITAPSFYQVNHAAAEILYSKARELASPKKSDLILDLYCGAGSIGLSMAKDAGEVVGIEIVGSAVECAKFNAETNEAHNASFYTGDASDTKRLLENAERLRGEKIKPDIIILDPPRGGCTDTLLYHIASLSPRKIVYISCNPATLARDMAILREIGYIGNEVAPVDMFPGTGHVESVVCLTRK